LLKKKANILFGDEAFFPQWDSLTNTWAKRGQQPVVKPPGNCRGHKVFGLIDYFSGRFFAKVMKKAGSILHLTKAFHRSTVKNQKTHYSYPRWSQI
jgi:hypothetical protein